MLEALRGLDQTVFNREVSQAPMTGQFMGDDTISYQQQQLQNERYDINKMEADELRDYKVVLSPKMREYKESYNNMSQADIRRLAPFGEQEGGFATTINWLRANDPQNPDIPLLEALRAQKILSDPQLMDAYGSEYGIRTGAIKEMSDQQRASDAIQQLEMMKEKYQTYQELITIDKIKAEIERIEKDSQYKDSQTIKNEYDILLASEELKAAPAKLEAELQATIELAKQRAASRASTYAGIEKIASDISVNQARKGLIEAQTDTEMKELEKISKENDVDENFVSGMYNMYLQSGLDIREFLKQPRTRVVNGREETMINERGEPITLGNSLDTNQLQALLKTVNLREPVSNELFNFLLGGGGN
jgi:hypothetical protein